MKGDLRIKSQAKINLKIRKHQTQIPHHIIKVKFQPLSLGGRALQHSDHKDEMNLKILLNLKLKESSQYFLEIGL
jgi:hypothetical protein